MRVSVQGEFESIFSNYQNLRMYKTDKVTTMPRNVHQLLNVQLILHVEAEDETINKIYNHILNGKETFTLGRNEDLVRLDAIKIISEPQQVKNTYLRHNAYIPDIEEYEETDGIKYRLNTTYHVENELRVWEKENVKYAEKGEGLESCLQDEDGDYLFLSNKRAE